MRICIIGSGAGGVALAADFGRRGFPVTLAEIPGFEERLEGIRAAGSVVIATGLLNACTPVTLAATIAEGVPGADLVIIATVAAAHARIASLLTPHLDAESAVVYFPGNLGSLFLLQALATNGAAPPPRSGIIVEANSLPYGCRILPGSANEVCVSVLTPRLLVSVRDEESNFSEVLAFLRSTVAPDLTTGGTRISTVLSNPNPLFHPLLCIANAVQIDQKRGDFYLYEQGITPAVLQALHALDDERMQLLRSVGGRGFSWNELRGIVDDHGEQRDLEFLHCGKLASFRGPDSLEHRYLVEDSSVGLVVWERIGVLVSVPTPIISSVITIASHLIGKDLRRLGEDRAKLITVP